LDVPGNVPELRRNVVDAGDCSLVWLPDVCNAWLAVIQIEHNLAFGQIRVLDSHRLAFPNGKCRRTALAFSTASTSDAASTVK
jgi:hypothetical protein